jgi:hypothetical protein
MGKKKKEKKKEKLMTIFENDRIWLVIYCSVMPPREQSYVTP